MAQVDLPVLLTALGELELINAFELRVFRRELESGEAAAGRAAFRKDLASGVLAQKPLPVNAFERAKLFARKRTSRLGTRSLDILHIASAAELQADAFYSFDQRQRKLAKAAGLKNYP